MLASFNNQIRYPGRTIVFVNTKFHSLPVQNGVINGEQLKVSISSKLVYGKVYLSKNRPILYVNPGFPPSLLEPPTHRFLTKFISTCNHISATSFLGNQMSCTRSNLRGPKLY